MNLRGIWAVFRKEFRENLRDRRTLLSALVFGPVISPDSGRGAGAVQHLARRDAVRREHRRGGDACRACAQPARLSERARRRHRQGGSRRGRARAARSTTQTHKIILEIPADFGARLQEGQPAPVILYSDSSRGFERRGVGRVRALVSQLRHRDRAAALPGARHRSDFGAADFRAGDRRVDAQRPFGAGAQHDDATWCCCRCCSAACISPSTPPPASASAVRSKCC